MGEFLRDRGVCTGRSQAPEPGANDLKAACPRGLKLEPLMKISLMHGGGLVLGPVFQPHFLYQT